MHIGYLNTCLPFLKSMHVFMYVCMYVRTYVCMYGGGGGGVCVCVCMYIHFTYIITCKVFEGRNGLRATLGSIH